MVEIIMMNLRQLVTLLLAPLLLQNHRVGATWSILAMDLETQQMGGALVTCLATDEISYPTKDMVENSFHAVPCRGALIAQGYWYLDEGPDVATTVGKPLLLEQSKNASSAQGILDALANEQVDGRTVEFRNNQDEVFETQFFRIRQYGVVTPTSAAAYTGEDLAPIYQFFGLEPSEQVSRSAMLTTHQYTVQGNVVANGTVQATADAYENPSSAEAECLDLPDRLLQALVAGSQPGGGDVRCDGETFGYLRVVGPNRDLQIDLQVHLASDSNSDALTELQQQLDAWKEEHPCGSLSQSFTCSAGTSATPLDDSKNLSSHASSLTFVSTGISIFVLLYIILC